jgi:hypothetical protein
MAKINMNEIIMGKIKMVYIIMPKLTMVKLEMVKLTMNTKIRLSHPLIKLIRLN